MEQEFTKLVVKIMCDNSSNCGEKLLCHKSRGNDRDNV